MPNYAHTLEVNASTDAIFAVLDDVTRTPEWLDRCTALEKLDDGPIAVGQRLTYHYKDGGRTGQMEGQVAAHEAGRRLTNRFTDKMMDVSVDFQASPVDEGRTSLTHTINIETKGIGRIFTFLIKRQLPGQTIGAMTKLKALVEG